jgi:hypothetical protein
MQRDKQSENCNIREISGYYLFSDHRTKAQLTIRKNEIMEYAITTISNPGQTFIQIDKSTILSFDFEQLTVSIDGKKIFQTDEENIIEFLNIKMFYDMFIGAHKNDIILISGDRYEGNTLSQKSNDVLVPIPHGKGKIFYGKTNRIKCYGVFCNGKPNNITSFLSYCQNIELTVNIVDEKPVDLGYIKFIKLNLTLNINFNEFNKTNSIDLCLENVDEYINNIAQYVLLEYDYIKKKDNNIQVKQNYLTFSMISILLCSVSAIILGSYFYILGK